MEVERWPTLDKIVRKGFSKELTPKIMLGRHGGATLTEQQMPFHEVG